MFLNKRYFIYVPFETVKNDGGTSGKHKFNTSTPAFGRNDGEAGESFCLILKKDVLMLIPHNTVSE